VLVTGGFGLVGSATVRRLAQLGRTVVVADLDTPANRKAAEQLPGGVTVHWADLTDAEQTGRLVAEVAPEVIVHLAAIIPPGIYKNRALARPGSDSKISLSMPTSPSRAATCSAALRSPGPDPSPKLVVSIRIRSRQISTTSAAGSYSARGWEGVVMPTS
jgi:NAD(P)-dependent dehydrogenase (short-subunit alcohol dehydrogenase family)